MGHHVLWTECFRHDRLLWVIGTAQELRLIRRIFLQCNMLQGLRFCPVHRVVKNFLLQRTISRPRAVVSRCLTSGLLVIADVK